ncbi:type VI secretion system transmembrane protein TssO [Chryseobacterium sp. 09-1422]|uniref:Type VI secretion system transmembrane protein TssO n=1 Tax=Chryseobacterium kimseyorum TaxID=2984028 RepID=A0ABT3HZM8_9FLAO|nr:type VI secretion system transmembrane protein TssO [Chryseobacterium kimseyorum]MCW3169255.1 type VI secretion system transmembrane protein TssO [Chryseobacterium kimseyorum]
MSTNRDKKLNKSDVRIGIWKFILSFVVLSLISFSTVFFFFKSYHTQRVGMEQEVNKYEELLGRSKAMKIMVDTISYHVASLDIAVISNDIPLRTQIAEEIDEARMVIGADSADNLKHYSSLLNHIAPMLNLKAKIIEASKDKEFARTELLRCTGKVAKVNEELTKDPSRNFSGGRRRR